MRASMYATIAAQTLQMDNMFIENPKLRPYFYNGKDVNEGDDDYDLVVSIAEYQLDYFDSTRTELAFICGPAIPNPIEFRAPKPASTPPTQALEMKALMTMFHKVRLTPS